MEPTAGSAASWIVLGALTTAVALQSIAGCGGGAFDTGWGASPFEQAGDYLAAIGPDIVLPALDRFDTAMESLEASLEALGDVDGVDGTEKSDAQAMFIAAFGVWQELEMMQIGPAGSSLIVVAGRDLRDEIYSWPMVSPCRVDQVTADNGWTDTDFFEGNQVNAYGLDALEYLLFAGLASECPGQVPPISDGAWDDLGDSGVAKNRAALAIVVASGVRAQSQGLHDAWSAEGDDFSAALALVGDTPYTTEMEALNAIFDALFYLESVTKDEKLAGPLKNTDTDPVEGKWSGTGLDAIAANLTAFEQLFTGGDGIGFDDLLDEVGHSDLATQILTALTAAQAAVESVEGPLEEAVTERPEQVDALYEAVKTVTDALKGDLATVLSLQIPSEAAGDSD